MSDYIQTAKDYLVDSFQRLNEDFKQTPQGKFITKAEELLSTDSNSSSDYYETEPLSPAVSPANKLPSQHPKYFPYNYSKMTPGNYFVHDTGYEHTSRAPSKGVVDNIYKKGLAGRYHSGIPPYKGVDYIEPTAWNNEVSKDQLGGYKKNKSLMQRLGAHGSAYEKAGRSAFVGSSEGVKILPEGSRMTSPTKNPVFVLKGDPNMMHEMGPDFKKLTPYQKSLEPHVNFTKPAGHIDKNKIVGFFPEGSNELMVKRPGMFTGRPTFSRAGSNLVDTITFPHLQYATPHETEDLFGNPIDQGAGFEPEMIPSPDEYGYEIEPLEYPDQGGTVPSTYGSKMVPNPRAGKARNPYGEI